MIKSILILLEKFPYRTKFGTSLSDELKSWRYWEANYHDYCLCGGKINTYGTGCEGWITECSDCGYIFDED
jgi:hypothetical protein